MSRIYKLHGNEHYLYPEDMAKILAYLKSHGELFVQDEKIEDLWEDFSDEYDAQWLGPDEELLERFARWLDQYDEEADNRYDVDEYGRVL